MKLVIRIKKSWTKGLWFWRTHPTEGHIQYTGKRSQALEMTKSEVDCLLLKIIEDGEVVEALEVE